MTVYLKARQIRIFDYPRCAQPLRAALTGRTTSPGIFDVLAVLGKSESLARLRDQFAG